MLTNATLISYTTQARPQPSGRPINGTTTAYLGTVRCLVDRPSRSHAGHGKDVLADSVARLFMPPNISPPPQVDGRITFRRDEGTGDEETLQIAAVVNPTHGSQSHFDVHLGPVR